MNKEIFRAYDIRGVVGESLTTEAVYLIGKAFGTQVIRGGQSRVVIGRDGRLSGPELEAALTQGLIDTGCQVVHIGQVPTPVLYFANYHLKIDSSIMITGSHNPPDYNGLKMVLLGDAIYGETIQLLYQCAKSQDFEQGKGTVIKEDLNQAYIDAVKSKVQLKKPLKLVVDCGNGVPGTIAPTLFKALGCDVISMFCEVDGNFPNHHPDPGDPKNLQDIQEAVVAHYADIGFAFDGDGDRLGVIDNQGKIIWPDRFLMLFAEDVLKDNPGATIIYDIKSSRDLKEVIERAGGQSLMWKTGHSLIKAKIKETKALLAGEMSGHVFIKDKWYGFDDALYTGARLLDILSKQIETSSAVFARYPENISTPELPINVREDNKFTLMKQLIDIAQFDAAEAICTLDGLRVDFKDGWGLVRPSNTSPKLISRFEAKNQDRLLEIQALFRAYLLMVEPSLELPF